MKTEVEYNFFWSKKSDTMQFYVNEGLKAVLSSEDLKLMYVAGNFDFLIRKGTPCAGKVIFYKKKLQKI